MLAKISLHQTITVRADLHGLPQGPFRFVKFIYFLQIVNKQYFLFPAEYDMVDPDTVLLSNLSAYKPNERHINWDAPAMPNGFILAYRAKLIKDDDSVSFIKWKTHWQNQMDYCCRITLFFRRRWSSAFRLRNSTMSRASLFPVFLMAPTLWKFASKQPH